MVGEEAIVANLPVPKESKKLPKRIRHAEFIEKADLWAARHLQKHLKKLRELAEGVLVQKTDKMTGEENVYRLPPDRAALIYLANRGMGTPAQRYEITGDEGGPIEVIPWMPNEEIEVVEEGALEEK